MGIFFSGVIINKHAVQENPIKSEINRRSEACIVVVIPFILSYGLDMVKMAFEIPFILNVITQANKSIKITIGIILFTFLIASIWEAFVLYPIKKNGKKATVREIERSLSAGENPIHKERTIEINTEPRIFDAGTINILQKNRLRRYHRVHLG